MKASTVCPECGDAVWLLCPRCGPEVDAPTNEQMEVAAEPLMLVTRERDDLRAELIMLCAYPDAWVQRRIAAVLAKYPKAGGS